jgi:hypothetical protein
MYSKCPIKCQRPSENPMLMHRNIDLNAVSLKANDCTLICSVDLSKLNHSHIFFCTQYVSLINTNSMQSKDFNSIELHNIVFVIIYNAIHILLYVCIIITI